MSRSIPSIVVGCVAGLLFVYLLLLIFAPLLLASRVSFLLEATLIQNFPVVLVLVVARMLQREAPDVSFGLKFSLLVSAPLLVSLSLLPR